MEIDVVFRPQELVEKEVTDRTVIVLDVLRATTSMAAALEAGVEEIRIFDDLAEAAREAAKCAGRAVLCGERDCLPPAGFDLGNSPGAFSTSRVGGRTVFMCTTNGTRAIVAARSAARLMIGALVNARGTARQAAEVGRNVTLLCAGTRGELAMEDVIGAGAVGWHLLQMSGGETASDRARMAVRLFEACRGDMRNVLADSQGGRNVIKAGLAEDIEFAARMDCMDVAGEVVQNVVRRCD